MRLKSEQAFALWSFGRSAPRTYFVSSFVSRITIFDGVVITIQRVRQQTATVSLLGNRYEVDQALCGRRVELRFDPYDLEVIEVHYAGRPCGHAVPHVIGRHVHPHAEEPVDTPRPVSGIDYLRLIGTEHERDWLSRRINYHQLHAVDNDAGDSDGEVEHDDDDDGAAAAAVR
jgi:hypothetical protein